MYAKSWLWDLFLNLQEMLMGGQEASLGHGGPSLPGV